MITVALPAFNSRHIVWLALESLTRQQVAIPWELIIAEENNGDHAGESYYRQFEKQLTEAGCRKIKYIPLKEWIPLSQKWRLIGKHADSASRVFILQATDCYSEPHRLQTAWEKVAEGGADWLQSKYGPFYNIRTGQLIVYEHCKNGGTGLNMATKTKHARNLPLSKKKKGVDSWFLSTIKNPVIAWDESDNWKKNCDTDTYNSISLKRVLYYDNIKPPFKSTSLKINDILPKSVVNTLKEMNGYITERKGRELTFVYPYVGRYAQGNEILYSIRSIAKHCRQPFKIAIIGDLPYYLTDVVHIPHTHKPKPDHWQTRHEDVTAKMLKAIESNQIPEDFIWMYDDIYFTLPFGEEDIKRYAVPEQTVSPTNGWRKALKETLDFADKNLKGAYNYETHLPRWINKRKMQHVINQYDLHTNRLLHFTVYYNHYFPAPEDYRDNVQARVTCKLNNVTDYMTRTTSKRFFNHNELAWGLLLEQFLKINFSYQSKHEIMKTNVNHRIALWLNQESKRFSDGVDLLLKVEKNDKMRTKFAREKIKEIKRGKPIRQEEEAFGLLKNQLRKYAARLDKLPKKDSGDDMAKSRKTKSTKANSDDLGTSQRPRINQVSEYHPQVDYNQLPANLKKVYQENKKLIKELSGTHAQMKREDLSKEKRAEFVASAKELDDKIAANWKAIDEWYEKKDEPKQEAKQEIEPEQTKEDPVEFEKKVKAAENYIYRYRNDEKKKEKVEKRKKWLEEVGRPYQRKARK